MNSETFPHIIADDADCRCGARVETDGAEDYTGKPGEPWGSDCPAALREALEAARQECETIRLQALTAVANATRADMEREEESDAMFLRLTEAEKERDAALARVAELEVVVNAARVLREDIRTIHEDDPDTGLCPICGTAEHEVGCTVPALDEALASLQYEALAAVILRGGE